MNHEKLAGLLGVSRSVLTRVLASQSGVPGRGKETRPKLFPLLSVKEIELLGWFEEFTAWLLMGENQAAYRKALESLFMEQKSSTGNTNVPSAAGVQTCGTKVG